MTNNFFSDIKNKFGRIKNIKNRNRLCINFYYKGTFIVVTKKINRKTQKRPVLIEVGAKKKKKIILKNIMICHTYPDFFDIIFT